MDECKACGKCCRNHWKVKLTNRHELELFKGSVLDGGYIWTDECKFLSEDGKCMTHGDQQPEKCKQYFCEGRQF